MIPTMTTDVKSPREEKPQDKRPPSSLSTGSSDSGVFSSGVHVSSNCSQPTEPSSATQTGPPSPTAQINSLLFQTANLMAVNEQLRKKLEENAVHNQMQAAQQQMLEMKLCSSPSDGKMCEIQNISTLIPPPQSTQQMQHQQNMQHLQQQQLKQEMQMQMNSPLSPSQLGPSQPLSLAASQSQRQRGERRMQKPESYKTVICQAWLESKTCSFAENCRFAHGEEELRPSKIEPRQNNKYKTKLCDKYTTTGLCPYGKRCLFIHPDHGPNAYIRADKLFEVSQRHALADLRDQMETQIMSGGRSVFSQPPPLPAPQPLLTRPTTPIENGRLAPIPLGPTPVSMRGPRFALPVRTNTTNAALHDDLGNRPHPSWPLEPSSFFAAECTGNNNNNNKMNSRPASPFESMMIGAAKTGLVPFTMMGTNHTPGGVSGYASGGSTPYQDLEASPFSPATTNAMTALLNSQSAAAIAAMANMGCSTRHHTEEDSFSMVPGGFDHLAEDMAKHLDLW